MIEEVIILPAVLKPNFDLFGFNVGEDGAFPDELLPPQRTGLWAFSIDPLQSLHLLRCVPHILAAIHLVVVAGWVLVVLHRKCHLMHNPTNTKTTRLRRKELVWLFFFAGAGAGAIVVVSHGQALFTKRAYTLLH